ncbi:MAG: NUDIX domain-containing protein [Spirochaetales bacterium]
MKPPLPFDWTEIDRLHAEGLAQGRQGVAGLLVVRRAPGSSGGTDQQVFAQRRSQTRKLFPGCWDLVGGHVEAGETVAQTAARELAEETGWVLKMVLGLRRVVDWQSAGADSAPVLKREFVLAIEAEGDLDHPALEATKVTEGRWFGVDELAQLKEGREGSDTYVFDLAREQLMLVNPKAVP